jgi:outer membrane murein-binding lipoprotein Lpp
MSGERVPKKKERGSNIVTVAIYIILGIIMLKIFGIIPDPPEYDINIVISLLSLATAILTGFSSWLSRRFSTINDKLDELEKNVQALSANMKLMEQKITSFECNVDIRERIARLEETKVCPKCKNPNWNKLKL